MNYTIERYDAAMKEEWDIFVSNAKNAPFLFRRDYIDYHADRFEDFSLIVRNEKGKITALLPANRKGEELESHGGLTYGGWIGGYRHFDVIALLDIQQEVCRFLDANGFRSILYKPVPYIYSEIPSSEDLYMLFRFNAKRIGSQISTVINLQTTAGPDKSQRRKARVALGAGLRVAESGNFSTFWEILSRLLSERYSTRPVHSLREMEMLRDRFPENIKLFTVENNGEITAGVVMYISGKVAHCQYIAASPLGKEQNALVLLFDTLIDRFRAEGYHWFDFGTSNEQRGAILNEGLVRQKISFGGRGVTYDIYRIPINELAENNHHG